MVKHLGCVLALLVLGSVSAFAKAMPTPPPRTHSDLITVTFKVVPPPHFRQSKAIYLAGNHEKLGDWKPDFLKLNKISDQEWLGQVELPKNFEIEVKATLGDWGHVEVDNDNHLIANRHYSCESACEIVLKPENFRVGPFHKTPVTTVGTIEYHHEIYYNEYQNSRSIAVYLPPHYAESRQKYPVIYATDGQNIFDQATASFGREWEVDENLELLIAQGKIPPVIVVGIYSTEKRDVEYLMNPNYVEFIAKKIKPFIDQRYRTNADREHTILLGSSWGANFALYAGWQFSNYFSRLGLVSGDFVWDDSKLINMVHSVKPAVLPRKIWMDMGDHEDSDLNSPLIEGMNNTYDQLIAAGVPAERIHKEVVPGGTHCEDSWAQRVGRVLQFLLSDLR